MSRLTMKDFRKVLFSFRSIFVFGICFSLWIGVKCESLDEKMRLDPDISEFWAMLEQCQLCNYTIQFEPVTVFAPINAAFQKMAKLAMDKDSLVEYHLTNVPKETNQLGSSYTSINARLAGSPPLWITHSSGKYHNDIYVNNARLLVSQSNIIGKRVGSKGTLTQILHKIDEVLIPTRSSLATANPIFNPSAWEFLENYESLIQGQHRVRNFRQKVQQNQKEDIFRIEGGHTFFIPVDEGFGNSRASLVDDKIIDGHVIPKQVLFTTPTKKDMPFQTLANGDNDIRVVISFTQEQRGNSIINYVKSHTLFSDGKHTPGVVLAEIVKANIPVKNGVVHLIHKPLMIVDGTIKELLQEHMDYICRVGNVQKMENIVERAPEVVHNDHYLPFDLSPYDPYRHRHQQYDEKDGGILNNFFNTINELGPGGQEFLRTIEKSQDVTLFAPCNNAFDNSILQSVIRDKQRFLDILKLHLVVDNRLYVETVLEKNKLKVYQAPTLAKGKNLYFNVLAIGTNRTMTVEGGGVNATVIQPDLAAKNGIIHIIDRVLGVPFNTVLEKLRTDPMLRATFDLGNMEGFNNQLNDTTKKFTYFVPSDKAWQDARVVMPSAIKQLFMREFSYHATTTLQRHLVIANEVYTMERIKQLTKNDSNQNLGGVNFIYRPPSVELPTLRGSLKLYVEEKPDNTFVIHWNDLIIPVFRPNVECTNGIIHVIELPFLKNGDIRVSGSTVLKPSTVVALIASTVFVKFVLQ